MKKEINCVCLTALCARLTVCNRCTIYIGCISYHVLIYFYFFEGFWHYSSQSVLIYISLTWYWLSTYLWLTRECSVLPLHFMVSMNTPDQMSPSAVKPIKYADDLTVPELLMIRMLVGVGPDVQIFLLFRLLDVQIRWDLAWDNCIINEVQPQTHYLRVAEHAPDMLFHIYFHPVLK